MLRSRLQCLRCFLLPLAIMRKRALESRLVHAAFRLSFPSNDLALFSAVFNKYAHEAIALVTGSKAGMVVGIIIAIILVIIIVLCVRQALKGLEEAKERALSKLQALIKREESIELLNPAPDVQLSAVQPASGDKKKLVRHRSCKVFPPQLEN